VNTSVLPDTWDIHLSSWIIQDGNYPDFEVGQIAEFALEFWVPDGSLAELSEAGTSVRNSGNGNYEAVAKSVVQSDQLTVLDVGIRVYTQMALSSVPAFPVEGAFNIRLVFGVDPYFYFEVYSGREDPIPLVYSWRIKSILRQTAPFVEVAPRRFTRDRNRLGYEEIAKTDAWGDDEGRAQYLLRCELQPVAAKNTSATAINQA
jgi:hypothetical protein